MNAWLIRYNDSSSSLFYGVDMSYVTYVGCCLASMLLFFVLDMIWLVFFAQGMYLKFYGPWLRIEHGQLLPVWWAMVVVYFLFSLGLMTFVLPLAKDSIIRAFMYGAVMGFIIYGVYDFTCLAIFKDWPVMMAFVDWAWGTYLCGLVASLTWFLSRLL